jgi:hypothetical protein
MFKNVDKHRVIYSSSLSSSRLAAGTGGERHLPEWERERAKMQRRI